MRVKFILAVAILSSLLATANAGSLGSVYELDASKKSELFKGEFQKTTKMRFTINVKRKKLSANNDGLTARLYVFATKSLTDEDVVHFKQTFANINLSEEREFSAETKTFDIIDKHGANPASVDKEYKGYYLKLTDANGQIVAVRSTHSHFEDIINNPGKR